jgi:hypothetical protein
MCSDTMQMRKERSGELHVEPQDVENDASWEELLRE